MFVLQYILCIARVPDSLFFFIFSEEFGINVMSNISDDYTFNVSHYGPQYLGLEDSGTTHLNVLAPDGQAVAVTS